MCLEYYPECGDGGDGCCEGRLKIALAYARRDTSLCRLRPAPAAGGTFSDCYRVERSSSRAGLSPAVDQRLFTAHRNGDVTTGCAIPFVLSRGVGNDLIDAPHRFCLECA